MRGVVILAAVVALGSAARTDPPTPSAPPPETDGILEIYPSAAKAAGVDGAATLNCEHTEHGGLVNCQLVSEQPGVLGTPEMIGAVSARIQSIDGVTFERENQRGGASQGQQEMPEARRP